MANARHADIGPISTLGIAFAGLSLALFCIAALYFSPPTEAAPGEGCANETLREEQASEALPNGSTFLPECMALEMVTPPVKYNQRVIGPQFSPSGDRVEFTSLAALANTPNLGSLTEKYVVTRTSTGWVTKYTAPPSRIVKGSDVIGGPCAYSTDLSRWVSWGSDTIQVAAEITTAYGADLSGAHFPIGQTLYPQSGSGVGSGTGPFGPVFSIGEGLCEGATADASRIFFKIAKLAYLPGDPRILNESSDYSDVYESYLDDGTPHTRLMQRDKDGVAFGASCGAMIGGGEGNEKVFRGAVSADASVVYFSTRPGQTEEGVPCDEKAHRLRIMRRLDTPAGPEIAQLISPECTRVSPPCDASNGDDRFIGASQEATKVYFSTTRQLADTDLDTAKDLYLYDATAPVGERLTQVSAGDSSAPNQGKDSNYIGLTDYSGDGTRAYFVAKAVLTTSTNAAGDGAQAGEPNLYLYERNGVNPSGRTVFIGTLSDEDNEMWFGTSGEQNQARAVPLLGTDLEDVSAGGDGRVLVFFSRASLAYGGDADTDGGEVDIYRYDALTGELERVSRAAPGGVDNGPFDVSIKTPGSRSPGAQSVSFGRWVSEDGDSIVFTTAEALDPADSNGGPNVYLWRDGALTSIDVTSEASVSMAGTQVAFRSGEKLLPEDGDGADDIYVARAGGGFPLPVPPNICAGEACQGAPGERPAGLVAASESFTGAGNPPAATKCRRGFARRKGRCVKRRQNRNRGRQQASGKRGGRAK